ncbi:hypothetical protein [Lacisediminimonas profundi]|uniref:hypothetical protein n=1 Tax=Lacisediminimonas profundi TaxID=2603856 RepID=UPI00124B7E37|nr:hypothetical protein [Lacisediminimonas profundi]
MIDSFFIEEGDYLVACDGRPLDDGMWEASAWCERKADQAKSLIPGWRHRIVGMVFPDADAAAQAAYQHVLHLIKLGKVEG